MNDQSAPLSIKRLLIILLPLLLTPPLIFLVSQGYISLEGGHEKTLIVFPWLFWSIVFFIVGLVRHKKLADNFLLFSSAFMWASVIMLSAWLCRLCFALLTGRI